MRKRKQNALRLGRRTSVDDFISERAERDEREHLERLLNAHVAQTESRMVDMRRLMERYARASAVAGVESVVGKVMELKAALDESVAKQTGRLTGLQNSIESVRASVTKMIQDNEVEKAARRAKRRKPGA